ncbi:uncharacterized protein LOC143459870 [Clavelina lepadiformis]|uniref:uncharacterized protein LOC143459870 n=1 Tax=Clavelina lepadiformis TaxID=159417 RepID=UPI0040419BDC
MRMAEMNVYENVQQQTKDSSHKKIDSSIKQSSTKLVVVVASLALLVAVISLILSSIAMTTQQEQSKEIIATIKDFQAQINKLQKNLTMINKITDDIRTESSLLQANFTKMIQSQVEHLTQDFQAQMHNLQKNLTMINKITDDIRTESSLLQANFSKIIQSQVEHLTQDFQSQTKILEKNLTAKFEKETSSLQSSVSQLRNLTSCIGGFIYENHCIQLPYVVGKFVSYKEALEICSGSLAEVTSDEMNEIIYRYIARTWVSDVGETIHQGLHVWLGSTFQVLDNPRNLITLKNGEKITLSNWQPTFPKTTDSQADRVVMYVQFIDHENRGISNRLPSLEYVVPLCSRAI